MSGGPWTLLQHVLHPLGLLERLGGIAVELDADRPLARGDEAKLRRVRADGRRLREPVVGPRTVQGVGEDAALARLDRLTTLAVADRHRVDDVLARVRRDRVGGDVEQIALTALTDLRTARRSAVGPHDEEAERAGEEHTARPRAHDW